MPRKYSDADRQELSQKLAQIKADGYSKPDELVSYAQQLVGHTFQDVLDLKLSDIPVSDSYGNNKRKGGLGNLLEEQYFAYQANSDALPDFAEAGMEFKATPVVYGKNRKKQEVIKAKERLVLTMIPNNEPIEADYDSSSLKGKSSDILLVHYLADGELPKLDQEIIMANRWQIPETDLEIIRDDYRTIAEMVQAGRAHELSEGMTTYLAACTKGASASKSLQDQYYPLVHEDGRREHVKAKRRAFSFKSSYMTAVAQDLEKKQQEADQFVSDVELLKKNSFDDLVLQTLAPFKGQHAKKLGGRFAPDLDSGAKNFLNALTWRLLGSKRERIQEFEKAGISVKTVRVQKNGKIREKLKLKNFRFADLHAETSWEESELYALLADQRYLFVVYQEDDHGYYFRGAFFWAVPAHLIGGEEFSNNSGTAYDYWLDTKKKLREGIKIHYKSGAYRNNFMKASENPVCHIRPSADKAAYLFTDGRPPVGAVERDSDLLPDGQRMTKQAFWLNTNLIVEEINKNI